MNRQETLIIDEYASADETVRLHLFLAHREFRDCFIQIEMEELSIATRKRAVRPVRGWLARFHESLEAI